MNLRGAAWLRYWFVATSLSRWAARVEKKNP
jgi:hypothetical protein